MRNTRSSEHIANAAIVKKETIPDSAKSSIDSLIRVNDWSEWAFEAVIF
jgi:hypothetical protein